MKDVRDTSFRVARARLSKPQCRVHLLFRDADHSWLSKLTIFSCMQQGILADIFVAFGAVIRLPHHANRNKGIRIQRTIIIQGSHNSARL